MRLFICAAMLLLVNSFVFSQKNDSFRLGKLDNGITYYLRKLKNPENKIYARLLVKAGFDDENAASQSISHFLEHVAYRGLKNFPGGVQGIFENRGLRRGQDVNASTGGEITNYYLNLPENDLTLVDTTLLIFRDITCGGLLFNPEEIKEERSAVLREYATNGAGVQFVADINEYYRVSGEYPLLDPRYYFHRRDSMTLFGKDELLKEFYQANYMPSRSAIVVIGDVNLDEFEKKIIHLFKDCISDSKVADMKRQSIPGSFKNTGRRVIRIVDNESKDITVKLFYKKPLRTPSDIRQLLRDRLMDEAVLNLFSARWLELKRQYNLPFLNVNSRTGRTFVGSANVEFFNADISVDTGRSFLQAYRWLATELERIRKFGFTAMEINNVRKLLSEQYNKNIGASDYIFGFLDGFIHDFDWMDEPARKQFLLKLINNFSDLEINRIVYSWIDEENPIDIIFRASAGNMSKLQDTAIFFHALQDVKKTKLTAFEPKRLQPSDLFKDVRLPRPALILDSVYNKQLNVTTVHLGNGATIILKPLQQDSEKIIVMDAFRPMAVDRYAEVQHNSIEALPEIVAYSGVSRFNMFDLQRIIGGRNLGVMPYSDKVTFGIAGNCPADDHELFLQLLYLYFTDPRYDSDAFAEYRRNYIQSINDSDSLSGYTYYSKNISGQGNTTRSWKKLKTIDIDSAFAFYKNTVNNVSGFRFIFCGDFNEATLLPLLIKYIGALPGRKTNLATGKIDNKISLTDTTFYANVINASVDMYLQADYVPSLKTEMGIRKLENYLHKAVYIRLREVEKGVYGADSRIRFPYPQEGKLLTNIQFQCKPADVDRLVSAVKEEIEKLLVKPLSDEEIIPLKRRVTELQREEINRADSWLYYLKRATLYNLQIDDLLKQDEILTAITANDLFKLAQSVFPLNAIQTVVLTCSE